MQHNFKTKWDWGAQILIKQTWIKRIVLIVRTENRFRDPNLFLNEHWTYKFIVFVWMYGEISFLLKFYGIVVCQLSCLIKMTFWFENVNHCCLMADLLDLHNYIQTVQISYDNRLATLSVAFRLELALNVNLNFKGNLIPLSMYEVKWIKHIYLLIWIYLKRKMAIWISCTKRVYFFLSKLKGNFWIECLCFLFQKHRFYSYVSFLPFLFYAL